MSKSDEKRISLRFRLSKERDIKAYSIIEELAKETGASFNEILLEMIIHSGHREEAYVMPEDSVEHIAALIIKHIDKYLPNLGRTIESREASSMKIEQTEELDELVLIGDDNLSFLDLL